MSLSLFIHFVSRSRSARICILKAALVANITAPVSLSPSTTTDAAAVVPSEVTTFTREIISAEHLADLRWPDFSDYQVQLHESYESVSYSPAWIREGDLEPQALAIIEVFEPADFNGPNAADYDRSQEIKAEVVSAFVWGEDSHFGAISSTIRDPLTGNAIHKLTYGPVEVSSRIGFERVSAEEVGTYLSYTTTIVNSSDSTLSVRHGGITIDGRAVFPLWVVLPGKKLNKRERKNKTHVVEAEKLQCFTSGFLSHEHVFSADGASQTLNVSPKTALTVSSVIRDPRSYPLRCSVEGCHPIGTIRYYLTVNSQDYVFVWPGQSAVFCGM